MIGELPTFGEKHLLTYLGALVDIAVCDGLHDKETQYINLQAELAGIDPELLWKGSLEGSREAISEMPLALKKMLVRDAITLAYIDGKFTSDERVKLEKLAGQMELPREQVNLIEQWLIDYWQILERGDAIFSSDDGLT